MPEPPSFPYDLFISCTKADLEWVQGFLLPELGLLPERVICNQENVSGATYFQYGAPIPDEYTRAVTGSRFTLLIFSPAYLADEWARFSDQLVTYVTVAEQRQRLIPVVREKCPLPLHIKFRVQLDCTDEDLWEAVAGKLRELLNRPEPKTETPDCPYPGMRYFTDREARVFFGREAEIDKIILALSNLSYFWIIGNSGSGKSSLIFAGVKPRLAKNKGDWLFRHMRPGKFPTQNLASTICSAEGKPLNPLEAVSRQLAANPPAQRLLLVIDQFEEIFTQAEQDEQARFIDTLKEFRTLENCVLLLAERADFYGELLNIKPLMTDDLWPDDDHKVEIGPLRGTNLRQAIQRPANDLQVYLESGLLERLVADAADEPGVLPFLQETMRQLWEKMPRRLLTLKAYERMGSEGRSGLAVAIASKANGTLDKLTAEQKAIARRIFLRLVQFGEGRANTRRQQTVAQLKSSIVDGPLFEQTLAHLAEEKNRLLTLSGEEQGQEKKVDISHEALITGWDTLAQWLETRGEAEKVRRRLEPKAAEWLGRGKKGGWLDEFELREAEHWLKSPDAADIDFGAAITEFVQASREHQKAEEKRWKELYEKAEQQKQLALARQLAAQSELERGISGESLIRSTLLGVESLRRQPTLEGKLAVGRCLELLGRELTRLNHDKAVSDVVFSPDGEVLATASVDETARLWDRRGRELARLNHDNWVRAVVFSPDGEVLATASYDKTARLWDRQGKELVRLSHDSGVKAVAFSPDGEVLATASYETARLWDRQGRELARLKPTRDCELRRWRFSPGRARCLATDAAAGRKTARLWDLQGKELARLTHDSEVHAVAFSPDGQVLATASGTRATGEGTARLWDRQGRELARLNHPGLVYAVAFSPDGEVLATASEDHDGPSVGPPWPGADPPEPRGFGLCGGLQPGRGGPGHHQRENGPAVGPPGGAA